jgi:hypothetical protein
MNWSRATAAIGPIEEDPMSESVGCFDPRKEPTTIKATRLVGQYALSSSISIDNGSNSAYRDVRPRDPLVFPDERSILGKQTPQSCWYASLGESLDSTSGPRDSAVSFPTCSKMVSTPALPARELPSSTLSVQMQLGTGRWYVESFQVRSQPSAWATSMACESKSPLFTWITLPC